MISTDLVSGRDRNVTDSVATQTTVVAVFVSRAVRRIFRRPDTIVSTVVFPVLLLLTMLAVFGRAVESFEGGDYAQRLVPGLIVSGVMFGSIGTAVGFWIDLDAGFMDRVRSMPVTPLGPLVGTVAAEAVRALIAVVSLVALGTLFGFRFQAGVVAGVAFFIVAAAVAMSVCWIGLLLATTASSQEALAPPLGAAFLVVLFFSKGLVPEDAYPGWARPIVAANPATSFVELLDALARGGALMGPIARSVGWAVAISIVFGGLALRRLRR